MFVCVTMSVGIVHQSYNCCMEVNNSKHFPTAGDESLRTELCHAIASEPSAIFPLADELATAGLIVQATANSIKFTDGRNPYEKASMMIQPALDRVNHNPQDGHQLVAILNRIGFEKFAAKLNTKSECVY